MVIHMWSTILPPAEHFRDITRRIHTPACAQLRVLEFQLQIAITDQYVVSCRKVYKLARMLVLSERGATEVLGQWQRKAVLFGLSMHVQAGLYVLRPVTPIDSQISLCSIFIILQRVNPHSLDTVQFQKCAFRNKKGD